jgi:clan AA aspartic protease
MGHVRVAIRIAHPYRRDEAADVTDALVDTGATVTTVPRRIAEQIGLDIVGQNAVRTATGVVTVDRSLAWIEIQGKDGFAQVGVSDTYPDVLVGVTTLEVLGFAVDPVNERLVDSELLLLTAV